MRIYTLSAFTGLKAPAIAKALEEEMFQVWSFLKFTKRLVRSRDSPALADLPRSPPKLKHSLLTSYISEKGSLYARFSVAELLWAGHSAVRPIASLSGKPTKPNGLSGPRNTYTIRLKMWSGPMSGWKATGDSHVISVEKHLALSHMYMNAVPVSM